MSLRFTPPAARTLRSAIRDAGGVEVFAIGHVEDGVVTDLNVTCRGLPDQVPALLDQPRTGQVVIHNHPSGDLRPSHADMHLAGMYGDEGVGVVIVDSEVTASNWVVEPHAARVVPVTADEVVRFFREVLPKALSGFEPREAQVELASRVAESLSTEHTFIAEAGTGTGKSLAYLIPAALWAKANDSKVVVSTYTKALQHQLWTSDVPVLARAGLDVRSALLQGRNNYLCKRRLGIASDEDSGQDAQARAELDALIAFDETSTDGSRTSLAHPVDPAVWERVESDSDLTLRVRCPHYETCHYYRARRQAAGAHLVIANHALLLSDRAIRAEGGPGVLPRYHRLIIDEAHHIEGAATQVIGRRSGLRGIQRATAPLVPRRKRRGALDRLLAQENSATRQRLEESALDALADATLKASKAVELVRERAPFQLAQLAGDALDSASLTRRLTPAVRREPLFQEIIEPTIADLAHTLNTALLALEEVLTPFDDAGLPPDRLQPVLDVRRATRRLAGHADVVRDMLAEDDDTCRWLEGRRQRGGTTTAELVIAPVEVGPTLKRILWDKVPGTVGTSATLTVGKAFTHYRRRVGLRDAGSALFPSPFDHGRQALLALPRDLPPPDASGFYDATCRVTADAIRLAGGGAFVLCTSYDAVTTYDRYLSANLPPHMPVLAQTRGSRTGLLDRFRRHPGAVLVGTDSFWEGVDVRGDALRLVVIPKLPFRVPTDPLQEARHERIERRGGDPFKAYALPEAVIKLKQGYGRLIRSTTDRGVVLLLDRRLHERTYGRVMLHSLPPARRTTGAWRVVQRAIDDFFNGDDDDDGELPWEPI